MAYNPDGTWNTLTSPPHAITPAEDCLLAAESREQLLQRDPVMSTWIDKPDPKRLARSRVARGLAPPPNAVAITDQRATVAPTKVTKATMANDDVVEKLDTAAGLLEVMRDTGAFDKRAANAVRRILDELEGRDATAPSADPPSDASARRQAQAAYTPPVAYTPPRPALTAFGTTNLSGHGELLDKLAHTGAYAPDVKRGVVNKGVEQVFGVPVAR